MRLACRRRLRTRAWFPPRHLTPGEFRLGVVLAARIKRADHRGMATEEFGDAHRRMRLFCDVHIGFRRFQQGPGVEWRQAWAGLAEEIMDVVGNELFARENDAAEHPALSIDVFVENRPRSRSQASAAAEVGGWRRHCPRPGSPHRMHDLGDRGDVDDLQRRIGGRFKERCFRVWPQRRARGLKVGALDQVELMLNRGRSSLMM